MRKLLFSFTYLQVDSSGFWQATIHFAQNNTTSWQHKIFHVTCSFHLLQFNLIGSLELKIPFRHYSVLSPVRNVVWLQCLKDSTVFPTFWILIVQFKFQAHQLYARLNWQLNWPTVGSLECIWALYWTMGKSWGVRGQTENPPVRNMDIFWNKHWVFLCKRFIV